MSEAPKLVDILGQTIEPGDTVVYPQRESYSKRVQMVVGTLVSYSGSTAQVRPEQGSRWKTEGVSRRSGYRDKRTGKGIDPYATTRHWRVPEQSVYVHADTGEEITDDEHRRRFPRTWGFIAETERRERNKWRWTRKPGELHDYVEQYRPECSPLTVYNTQNIVKVVKQ